MRKEKLKTYIHGLPESDVKYGRREKRKKGKKGEMDRRVEVILV